MQRPTNKDVYRAMKACEASYASRMKVWKDMFKFDEHGNSADFTPAEWHDHFLDMCMRDITAESKEIHRLIDRQMRLKRKIKKHTGKLVCIVRNRAKLGFADQQDVPDKETVSRFIVDKLRGTDCDENYVSKMYQPDAF